MNPRVTDVKENPDFTLSIIFSSGEVRRFDVKPYLGTGIFRQLRDPQAFQRVKPVLGSIQWAGGQDLCPDALYEESEPEDHADRQSTEPALEPDA
ncbi:MAG: DUF2442 domain-containing protein [Deferrisomatales bacterium]